MIINDNINPLVHQKDAVNFFLRNVGKAILAHDVGCRKTGTTLLCYHHLKKAEPDLKLMIFCPPKLINKMWGKNLKLFTNLNYYNCREDKAYYLADHKEIDVFVINYESMIRPKHEARLRTLLSKHDFMGVLDESHKIKDKKTSSAKVLNGYNIGRKKVIGLRNFMKYKLCLSGTPAPNNELEWFSQMYFLNPEIFNMKWIGFILSLIIIVALSD